MSRLEMVHYDSRSISAGVGIVSDSIQDVLNIALPVILAPKTGVRLLYGNTKDNRWMW